jgi:7,8-dihydro-6-hydroxymethylpterin-pyrophosphokinase
LWHIDLLVGKDREINNEAMAIPKQQLRKYTTVLEPLQDSGPRSTIEVLLEAMFSM